MADEPHAGMGCVWEGEEAGGEAVVEAIYEKTDEGGVWVGG